MITLALDLGTTLGWALGDAEGLVLGSGSVLLAKPGDHVGRRYIQFLGWMNALGTKPDRIVYEDVKFFRGIESSRVWCGLLAVLRLQAYRSKVPLHGLHIGTVKKHATGSGNADKAAMVAAARKRWSFEIVDDNHADALWILDTFLARQ